MKGLIIFSMVVVMAACSTTHQYPNTPEGMAQQAENDLRKMDKESKKAAQAAYDQALFNQAVAALESREFVLEADRVDFKKGRFAYVNSSTNFVSMHGNRATIQFAFNSPYAGPNGIGGLTVDGTASNVQMKTDSKRNVTFSMMVQGTGVSANVTLRMIKDTNRCTAIVTPNFNSNRTTFTGVLYPESESNVYKGRAL
ncbi:MAG: DUF4251 domain-containing protein [Tannerellaceae bacterium]|nr:DUF4251 domain-containing protein [Tannerellaceae bacterium]